jgi:hypothetical protein
MENFFLKLSEGLSKPMQKFVSQLIYGIQAGRDIKLSNISRALNEEIKLIKTENRLNSRWGLGKRRVRGDPGQLLFDFAKGW